MAKLRFGGGWKIREWFGLAWWGKLTEEVLRDGMVFERRFVGVFIRGLAFGLLIRQVRKGCDTCEFESLSLAENRQACNECCSVPGMTKWKRKEGAAWA